MKISTYEIVLAILILAIIIFFKMPVYQFYDVKLSHGHIQLRGNMVTGKLEQIYIE